MASRPVPTLLTPVESSDDDLDGEDFDLAPTSVPSLDDSNTISDNSICSIEGGFGDDPDTEMVDSQPRETLSPPRPWQRPRSNDMLAPPLLPHLQPPVPGTARDRIATPIYGHFDQIDLNGGNNQRPSAALSPLIIEDEEAGWWRRGRLPSPTEDADDLIAPLSQTDFMMDRLNVSSSNNSGLSIERGLSALASSTSHVGA